MSSSIQLHDTTFANPIINALPSPIIDSVKFEKATWVNGSVADDPFYAVPPDAAQAKPGTLLKIEVDTNITGYFLPPATALSRIMYVSENLNGDPVPASAAVLWPYMPLSQPDGYPVVAWAHGTSGINAEYAPSHLNNFWNHFLAPYQLCLNGYVVVATDYAGLGIGYQANGEPIVHEYLASPSHANDVVYSVQAAQSAFSELSKSFVVMGHSQGGAAAWAVAERQSSKPMPGMLGSIAVSPVTNILKNSEPFRSVIGIAICPGLAAAFPNTNLSSILTPKGLERLALIKQLVAGVATSIALLLDGGFLQPHWDQTAPIQRFISLASNGGKRVGCPLIVLQGEADPRINEASVTSAVKDTLERYPDAPLEYTTLPDVSHVPALTASQRIWMRWIEDRFAGVTPNGSVHQQRIAPARPEKSYQKEQNWFLERATEFYQAP